MFCLKKISSRTLARLCACVALITLISMTILPLTAFAKDGSDLPSTGGSGNGIFYIIGAVIIVAAIVVVIILVIKKKKSSLY